MRLRSCRFAARRNRAPFSVMKFRLPLLRFLPGYTRRKLGADLKAGSNVALLDFPQGMAYAMIAGLPVNFGIYSSALGSITGALFGSSRYLMLGPTNATAVLLLSGFLSLNLSPEQRIIAMPLLLLMVATFMIVGALMRADLVIRYVSRSVITGYVTAAAALIIIKQLKNAAGIEAPATPTFIESLVTLVQNLGSVDLASLLFSIGTLAVALVCRRWLKALPNVAITLLIAGLAAAALRTQGIALPLLASVPVGSWPISALTFSYGLMEQLIGVAAAIAFLSLLESVSIAKSLAAQAGDRVDVRQQMMSMGIADAVNAVGSGMPVSGSLTRSTLNYESGARTPISSLFSGALLVVGALLLGPVIGLIPQAALATMVILVGVSLIKPGTIRLLTRVTRSDSITFVVTLVSGLLFPLDTAIYVGVSVSVLLFLRKVSTPQLIEYDFNQRGELAAAHRPETDAPPAISIMHLEGDLFFGATDAMEEQLRQLTNHPKIKAIILRLKNAHNLDATGALALRDFAQQARQRDVHLLISGATPPVLRILRKVGLVDLIGSGNVFRYTPANVTLSTRNALRRAQQLLQIKSADIMLLGSTPKPTDTSDSPPH
jgi:sulfate permease, SulP family